MKTPTVDDPKPKRDNLGPTGPANVSADGDKKSEDGKNAADGSYEKEIENILDCKRAQTPPG